MSRQLSRRNRKLLAEGMLISRILYLITVWGIAGNPMITAQRLQNKMARWITGCGRRIRVSSLLEEVGWWSIQEMAAMQSLAQIWKIIYLKKPEIMRDKIVIEDQMHLTTRAPRLTFTESSFLIRTVRLWNTLPLDIKETESLPRFKKLVKRWTLEKRNQDPD